jgi:hypothetical protein
MILPNKETYQEEAPREDLQLRYKPGFLLETQVIATGTTSRPMLMRLEMALYRREEHLEEFREAE